MLIDDVYKEYIYEIRIRNYTERTIKGYRNNLNKFFTYCKNEHELLEIEEITHIHIKQYLNQIKSKGLSESYINTILKNIRSFYAYCYKEEYCLNVAKKVEFLREKTVLINTFTDAEVRKMLDAYRMDTYMNARNRCIISILLDAAIINTELCNIKNIHVRERKECIMQISMYLRKS